MNPGEQIHRTRSRLAAGRRFAGMVCLGMCVLSDVASGQVKEDPLKVQRGANVPGQAPPGIAVVQQQQRPFYLQGAVVALLTGGAVWTVCRGSRRQ